MRIGMIALIGLPIALAGARAQSAAPGRRESQPLSAIVGVWQSNAVNGVSARSNCAWSPDGAAVICEQAVTTPQGVQHALNFFMPDPRSGGFAFYVLNNPGDTIRPVPLTIDGAVWTYGGQHADPNGQTWRTINDFSKPGEYTWKAQVSADGKIWKTNAEGRSERVTNSGAKHAPDVRDVSGPLRIP